MDQFIIDGIHDSLISIANSLEEIKEIMKKEQTECKSECSLDNIVEGLKNAVNEEMKNVKN